MLNIEQKKFLTPTVRYSESQMYVNYLPMLLGTACFVGFTSYVDLSASTIITSWNFLPLFGHLYGNYCNFTVFYTFSYNFPRITNFNLISVKNILYYFC